MNLTMLKLGLVIAWTVIVFATSWRVHTWRDEAAQEHIEAAKAQDLGKGVANIITENQKLDKELSYDKDPCLDTKLPANIGKL